MDPSGCIAVEGLVLTDQGLDGTYWVSAWTARVSRSSTLALDQYGGDVSS